MNPPFSAWKEGAVFYAPPLLLGIVLLPGAVVCPYAFLGLIPLLLGLFALYFFRDPVRAVTAAPNELVSPADGTIVAIEDLGDSPHYDGPCKRISIFLSVLNVHVNRSPAAGVIKEVEYRPGQFLNAMKAETTDCNESNTVRIDAANGALTVRQISGLIARRIICRRKAGDTLAQGEKFGMIRFGSRTELYMPPRTTICVKIGDTVRAGLTVLGRF